MATLMKCNQPHWQGNTFVPAGTVYPAGHHAVIPEFFETFEVDETPPPEPKRRGRPPKAAAEPEDVAPAGNEPTGD